MSAVSGEQVTTWREISPDEVAMVDAIVSASGIPEGQPLLDDLPGAVVQQGTVWIYDVKTPNTAPGTPLPNGPFPARAYVPNRTAYRGEILLWGHRRPLIRDGICVGNRRSTREVAAARRNGDRRTVRLTPTVRFRTRHARRAFESAQSRRITPANGAVRQPNRPVCRPSRHSVPATTPPTAIVPPAPTPPAPRPGPFR